MRYRESPRHRSVSVCPSYAATAPPMSLSTPSCHHPLTPGGCRSWVVPPGSHHRRPGWCCSAPQPPAPAPRRTSVPPGRVLHSMNSAAMGSSRLPPLCTDHPSLSRARSHPRLVLCVWRMRRPLAPHARPQRGGRHGGGPLRGVPRRGQRGRDRRQANQAQMEMGVGPFDATPHQTPVKEMTATRNGQKEKIIMGTNDGSELRPQNHPAPKQA